MIAETLKSLYVRDLTKLKQELALYTNEEHIWLIDKDILNSAGNLTLHLVGNLNAYIGAQLGGISYIRNRPEEFSLKNIPRQQLISQIDSTIDGIEKTLSELTEAQLADEYPQTVVNGKVSTEYFLMHLAMHLSYHLGQVNYHRRLLGC